MTSGTQNFATFMRLLAPPTPAPDTPSIVRGRDAFSSVGCALCHPPSLMTSDSDLPGLAHQQANLFSDLLVHHMGVGLADGVQQGNQARTNSGARPYGVGLGQRIFLLHDGRTKDLMEAIQAHRSDGSEANLVIQNFTRFSPGLSRTY